MKAMTEKLTPDDVCGEIYHAYSDAGGGEKATEMLARYVQQEIERRVEAVRDGAWSEFPKRAMDYDAGWNASLDAVKGMK